MNAVHNLFKQKEPPEVREGNLFLSFSGTIYILVLVGGAWATVSLTDGQNYRVSGLKSEAIKDLILLGDATLMVKNRD